MIAFVRTANIAPGKTAAAIGFAQEISGYCFLAGSMSDAIWQTL